MGTVLPKSSAMPAAVHLDTGMSRLGLAPADQDRLAGNERKRFGFGTSLACRGTPEHPMNEQQREDFAAIADRLPTATRSLAASSGIFLGPEWHFDMVRAGISMYGGAPNATAPNSVAPVVTLNAIVLQIRDVDRPETVGYGATHRFTGKSKVATIAYGYAGRLSSVRAVRPPPIGGKPFSRSSEGSLWI